MNETISVSNKTLVGVFEIPPVNLLAVPTGTRSSVLRVFDPGIEALTEDAEDAADAARTGQLYAAQGLAAFLPHRPLR